MLFVVNPMSGMGSPGSVRSVPVSAASRTWSGSISYSTRVTFFTQMVVEVAKIFRLKLAT